MSIAISDTVLIEAPSAGTGFSFSGQSGGAGELATVSSNIIDNDAVFGNAAKQTHVSYAVFAEEDTMLDWVALSKKLDRFRALRKGWDGYQAAPPGTKPLESAEVFLDLLRQCRYMPSRLAPSVVGGVGMTFRKEGRKVYVEFSNKDTIHILFSDGVSEPIVQKMTPDLSGYSGDHRHDASLPR